MKLMIKEEKLDVNSTELKDLYLENVYVGKYSYGDYSKYAIVRAESNRPIAIFENCIYGMINKHFGIAIYNKEDVYKTMKICKEKYNVSLIEWINDTLHKLGESYNDN